MRKWNNKQVDVDLIPAIEFARLAAFIDGEGCLRIQASGNKRSRNQYHTVRLIIGQADVRLMEWLIDTFGGRYDKGGGGTNRQMYYWMCDGSYMTALLERCMPYFILKGEQAKIILDYKATIATGFRTPVKPEVQQKREELRSKLLLIKHPEKQQA